MAELDVDIVAVERKIWSGKATFVFTRTTSGEIGILPNHIPLVAQLVDDAMVRVERDGEDDLRIAVDGGYLSVTEAGVRILAESAEFASEINADTAKTDAASEDPQTAARGRIMDADFASETANLARAQILQQAGTAMLAQANALPQQVLQLLKG
jgi:F-type H+-transporting ATPase subunit epsilon